jgi:drug/metabolite transporter (DMT)-like permease
MVCFASNSLLCRLALRSGAIDAVSFTAVRLVSAAVVMTLLVRLGDQTRAHGGSWTSAVALFAYAIAFSIAYLQIGAGIGALLLFGAVQITMIGWALLRGERPGTVQWIGIVLAVVGLVLLTRPGISGSPLLGMALMLVAGVGWGIYSLRGRGSTNPLETTAANFIRTLPLVAIMVLISVAIEPGHLTARGVALSVASGGVTSGIGYVIWYRALAKLTAVQAASVQLTVPVLAAAGGVALLGEQVTLRLLAAAALTLGGIALTIVRRTPAAR